VNKPAEVGAMFDQIKQNFGQIDILVNSVANSTKGRLLDTPLAEWNRITAVNLTDYFLCIQHPR